MTVTRRHLLQLGGLSALVTAVLTLPMTGGVLAKSASKLSDRLMPRPYRSTFSIPSVLDPVATGVDEFGRSASYVIPERKGTAQIPESRPTPVWETHPLFGHRFATSTHLHGNASLPQYDGYDATDRALLPQRPFDVPLTVSDVMFAGDGSPGYDDCDHSGLWHGPRG